jgi:propionyl-CoA:succinyl-CoA transferase
LATQHGVADLLGKIPSERARITVEHCSAPEYRDQLKAYLAFARIAAVVPLVLAIHRKFEEEGGIRSVAWAHEHGVPAPPTPAPHQIESTAFSTPRQCG